MCVCVYLYIYTHNEILLSHKKEWIISFETTQTDLENVILSEISQTERNKCYIYIYSIYYMLYEELKNNINESVHKIEMDSKA